MTVVIPEEFAGFVDDEVASGRFRSTEEVLGAALRLLRDRERKWDALKADVDLGLEAIKAGRVVEYDADESMAWCERRLQAER